jgi:hypothetical protein
MKISVNYSTTIEGDNAVWMFDDLPLNWELKESLQIPCYNIEKGLYPISIKTDTFEGSKKKSKEAKKYLKTFFENLLKEKIIEYYKFSDKNDEN